ncbi:MAG: glycerol-3-phosphate 1-O-acyltransferase PlsY [Candidatus Actinomarina sp.]|nr:glycerol-3-phosphate 1-O-acyltransferase PlsY [Candidatus Actinomarina sp.]MBL6763104.1 glycerol-3-phosphate 1-O-acyltransferase PlsY [Candidatus Actinomarina sp.]MBL6836307.1 glycerol-3-phosphate 1-O-acyltransferase PlsY [Candidatus Actinomarina sp.]
MNFLAVILSYLLGSINFAYITARIKGIDISSQGSGNPGTSNVLRTLGKRSAAIVLFGDLLKGAIPIVFFYQDQYFLAYGLAAVIGHIYPVFYKFKGGKGVATYLGVYIATVFMNPYNSDLFNIEIFQILNIPALAFVYFVVFKTTRVSAIASLSTVLITVSLLIYTNDEISNIVILFVIFFLILLKHSENIKRLREGKENKF